MNDSTTNYSLVLIGRYPGKDMAVAQALALCMGREELWGLRVVSAAPIVFFEKLSMAQARQFETALAEVSEAGCRFEIQPGTNTSLPKVGWSNPPKIHGLTLDEIARGGDPRSAPTEQPLSPSEALNALNQSLFGNAAQSTTQATATLMLPCPYTGQKMKLTISVALSRADSGTALSISASAAAPTGRQVDRSVNATSGSIILPDFSQLKQSQGYVQAPKTGRNNPVAVEKKRDDQQLISPPAGYDAPPLPISEPDFGDSKSWSSKTPAEIPLPDVPVLPSSGRLPGRPATSSHQPLPLDGPAMDISAFEASLGVESQDSGQEIFSNSADFDADENLADDPDSESILCSVFIERSSSPVVHELVAELHGIPEAEASEICVSGSVALAENIPLFEAKDIKRRCAAINVFARVIRN